MALAAAFGRIFFANLTAETPGEFWGPRIYTVLPITLILFFVYTQLGPEDVAARDDRGLHFDSLIAYLGTATVIALLYFQFANEWLVTAWAVVVFVLFGIALALDRPIFLHQALLLTLGACARGVMYNLFGASYFTGTDWTGRYLVLGSGIAVLLACLPFAFQWRARYKTQPSSNWIAGIAQSSRAIDVLCARASADADARAENAFRHGYGRLGSGSPGHSDLRLRHQRTQLPADRIPSSAGQLRQDAAARHVVEHMDLARSLHHLRDRRHRDGLSVIPLYTVQREDSAILMKRVAAFVIVLSVATDGLYFSQRRHDPTPVSANAIVAMAADAQRDLSRAPMRLTRLSDDEEIAVGKELAAQYSVPAEKFSPEEHALEDYTYSASEIP